jgi:hypothetical protein
MDEQWKEIPEFPWYSVSNRGVVTSDRTGRVLIQNYNQQGIPSVGMIVDGKVYRRSVQVLVAKAFLPPPMSDHYNTPIHLDGDKANNHVENLVWRPRWFAIKYHQQFEDAPLTFRTMSIEIIKTGEVFEHAIDLCMKYGVLARDVVHAALNENSGRNVVPFGWFEVRALSKADINARRNHGT